MDPSTLQSFIITDQPETCPEWGARTEFIEYKDYQIHSYLNCNLKYRGVRAKKKIERGEKVLDKNLKFDYN